MRRLSRLKRCIKGGSEWGRRTRARDQEAINPARTQRPPCAQLAELPKTVKDGTVLADIKLGLLLGEVVHVCRRHSRQKVDVLVRVEASHLQSRGWRRSKDLEVLEEAVVGDEVVGHADAMRLHGVRVAVVVVANVAVVVVSHALLAGGGHSGVCEWVCGCLLLCVSAVVVVINLVCDSPLINSHWGPLSSRQTRQNRQNTQYNRLSSNYKDHYKT